MRVAWALWVDSTPPSFSDAEFYHATAKSLAGGDGYSVHFDSAESFRQGGEPTAFWPPGYSLVLAASYWLFGDDVAVGQAVNVVAGALTVIPVYFIGRRLLSTTVGLTGAGIAAVMPSLVLWTPVLLSETVFSLLFACAIWAFLYSVRANGAGSWRVLVLAGLLIGGAALVRGQALPLLALVPVWWLLHGATPKRAAGSLALVVGVAVIAIAPWSIRNAIVMDSPVLLSTNFGYNLRIGHAEYSTGGYLVPQDLWDVRPGITFQEREHVFNDVGRSRALDYVLAEPRRELELAGRKIMWLWRPDSDGLDWVTSYGSNPLPDGWPEPLRWLVDVTYVLLIVAAAVGLARLVRSRSGALMAALLIGWTGLHVVFFGEPRFHLPLLAVLAPFAAAAALEGARTVSHLARRSSRHERAPESQASAS